MRSLCSGWMDEGWFTDGDDSKVPEHVELHSLSLEGGCELPGSELWRAVTDMTVSGAGWFAEEVWVGSGKNNAAKRLDFLNLSGMGILHSNLGVDVNVSLFYRVTLFRPGVQELYLYLGFQPSYFYPNKNVLCVKIGRLINYPPFLPKKRERETVYKRWEHRHFSGSQRDESFTNILLRKES